MLLNFSALESAPRLLIEVTLKPVQGERFQPTGFPNLGAAIYKSPNGNDTLLVESAQSMANRMEAACWDDVNDEWVYPLNGLPVVRVKDIAGEKLTNSVLEAHRLNSPYIENTDWFETLKSEIGYDDKVKRPIDMRKVQRVILKYDPNSLLHGFFLESIAGVIRSPRALSAFIEADGINVAASGGVKNDRVDPTGKSEGGGSSKGYGNVPFARDEFVAQRITAYFNLDLAQIRGFGVDTNVQRFLIAFAIFKIRKFLAEGLRLRTACDLEVAVERDATRQRRELIQIISPENFVLPSLDDLINEEAIPRMIRDLSQRKGPDGQPLFADPPETTVTWKARK